MFAFLAAARLGVNRPEKFEAEAASPVRRMNDQFAAWSLHRIGWIKVGVSGKFKPIFK